MSDSEEWFRQMREAWGTDVPFVIEDQPGGAAAPPGVDLTHRRSTIAQRWANVPQDDPPGAVGGEIGELATSRNDIANALTAAPTEQTLTQLDGQIDLYVALRQRVGAAANGRARVQLVASIGPESRPDGADEQQFERIKLARGKITGLPDAPTDTQLADARKDAADLPNLMDTVAREITQRRTDTRAALVAKCPAEETIDGADTSQLKRIADQRGKITGLPAVPGESELKLAGDALAALPGLLVDIRAEIDKRRTDARALLVSSIAALVSPAGADAGQKERVDKQRERITGLPTVPNEMQLGDGQKALDGLPGVIAEVKAEIEAVEKRATLVTECDALADPPDADAAQLVRLTAQRDRVHKLPAIPDSNGLKDGQAAVDGLPGLIKAIETEIAAAKQRAKLVLDCNALVDPPDADAAQLVRLKKERDRINNLPAVPDAAGLLDGANALAGLPGLISTIAKEIADEQKRLATERAAVLAELAKNPRVRTACLDFYDHLGREEDVPALCDLLDDPIPSVRRQAVHSLACQRCKPAPLQADLTETLIGLARHDPTPRVRREAVYGLGNRPADPRAVAALERIVAADTNLKVVREARSALERLSPIHRLAAINAAKARQKLIRDNHDVENTQSTNSAGD